MIPRILQISLILVSLSVLFLYPRSLKAEFTCTGLVCEKYPDIGKDFNQVVNQLEDEYLTEILKNNTESAFVTNILSNSVGRGKVNRFQVGVGLSAAGGKKDDITIQNNRVSLPDLPNGGISLNPAVNLDLNLGWILRTQENSHWRRFTIFLHGMSARFQEGDLKIVSAAEEKLTLAGRMESWGGMIRYQAVQPKGFGGYYFSWHGINLGAGAHTSKQSYNASYRNEKAETVEWNGLTGKWGGDTEFLYKTQSRTYHIDARTGLGVLWMIHFIVGGGYSWNSGESQVSLQRSGPYVLQTGAVSMIDIPREYQEYFNQGQGSGLEEGGQLSLKTEASARSKRHFGYWIAGLEFDFFAVKANIETVYVNPHLMGANFAIRMAF